MSDQNSDPSRPFDPPVSPTAPPAAPVAPPAPPVAPEPPRPEVPQYGEYASNPYGVPGYPAAPASQTPADTAGVPAYGGPAYGSPVNGAAAYAPAPRKRRTWDIVLTSILLFLGLLGMAAALLYAVIFANPELLDEAMRNQGFGGFSGNSGAASAVLAISHIVLYLIALGVSIPLLIRGKVVVFWIPLAIGVIAAIIFWVVVFNVIASDPGFLSRYGG